MVLVGRETANVLSESTVGIIVTSGDPRSNLDNTLVGMDFRYRQHSFERTGRNIEAEAWVHANQTECRMEMTFAYGLGFRRPNNTRPARRGGRSISLKRTFAPPWYPSVEPGFWDRDTKA